MITVRRAGERGRTHIDWLDSRHTFSFGEYNDPHHMGFGSLRVLNDDVVAPRGGFPTHGHRDMEILSYVLDGTLEHKDSLGNGSAIRPGEIQFMRAGTGVLHSEFNPSPEEPVHFLQIWILPGTRGLQPAYAQRAFDREAAREAPLLLASGNETSGAIHIRQDASVFVSAPPNGVTHVVDLGRGRRAWVQVARGTLEVNGHALSAGDGLAVEAEARLEITGATDSEALVFDLA